MHRSYFLFIITILKMIYNLKGIRSSYANKVENFLYIIRIGVFQKNIFSEIESDIKVFC